MKTKLLYLLTSKTDDLYLEQALVSIYTAKYYMPDSHVTLLTDNVTRNSFVGTRKRILDLTDEIVSIDLGKESDYHTKSRLLKTNMRNFVDGDFLFVDCDTVFTTSVYEIDGFKGDIMSVKDGHLLLDNHYSGWDIKGQLKAAKVNVNEVSSYWNSGVLYIKDNNKTRKLFENYHRYYKESLKDGVRQDQPAFCKAYLEMPIVTELAPEYNVQLMVGLQYITTAKILHFFNSCRSPLLEIASNEFLTYVKGHGIDEAVKSKILNPLSTFLPKSTIVREEDFYYHFSPDYKYYKNLREQPHTIDGCVDLLQQYIYNSQFSLIDKIFVNILLFTGKAIRKSKHWMTTIKNAIKR